MMHGDHSWSSELEDISATGVLVRKPEGWHGMVGEMYILDMLFGDTFNIHVEAMVMRVTDNHLGFAYERIPPDKEIPLWNLLGGYADKLEPSVE